MLKNARPPGYRVADHLYRKMTKQIDTFQSQEKEYTGTMVLGETTPSYDMETDADQKFEISHITEDEIRNAYNNLSGGIPAILAYAFGHKN